MTIDVLEYLANMYNLDLDQKPPIFIASEEKKLGRWHALPEIFLSTGLLTGAEIGVEEGRYSKRLCDKIPGLKLFSIDPWDAYKGYRDHVSQNKLDRFYNTAQERLAPYDCTLIRKYSIDAAKDFEDGSLDFVYIDGNHRFIDVAQDIFLWEKKVRVGGIVAGHDFKRQKRGSNYICHVKDVVQAWTYAHGIRPWFVLRGDKAPSWLWVKV